MGRINVDVCACDIITNLVDDQESFHDRFIPTITKTQLQVLLRDVTYCHSPHGILEWVRAHEFCEGGKKQQGGGNNIGAHFTLNFIIAVNCYTLFPSM